MADPTTRTPPVPDPTPERVPGAPLPDRVTMPLLSLINRDAIDEDYVHAARRRAAAGPTVSPRPSYRGVLAVTAVFGLLVALAALQTARNADVQSASRAALIERIDQRRTEVSSLEERLDSLREQNAELRDASGPMLAALTRATARLRALQVTTGFVAVRGEGVRVTVDDSPDGTDDGRVRASDLRLLVNGLWQAGAEAIAVNGRRLTALSAIVNSNIAVQVNRSPLTPPYVVSAIGDSRTLQADLAATTTGVRFRALADQFGFVVEAQNEDELVLPAAPEAQLRLRSVDQRPGADNQEETP